MGIKTDGKERDRLILVMHYRAPTSVACGVRKRYRGAAGSVALPSYRRFRVVYYVDE